MEPFDDALEKSAISEIDASLKRLNKSWVLAKRSLKEWDFKTSAQSLEGLTEELDKLSDRWQEQEKTLTDAIAVDQQFVQSDDYATAIEEVLKTSGIPVRGEFPNYEFPPFKLTFNREQGYVRLSVGRRSQQTKAFAPEQLGNWVLGQYRKVIESKFDATRFCKELLSAYELLNTLMLKQENVAWGHSVPLKDIYRLLTLKQAAKQDYPEALFVFDLARLKEQVQIQYDRYQFDLEPSRNPANSFLLVNSEGQESRVSTLAIHLMD
jgi:hypothetical protein